MSGNNQIDSETRDMLRAFVSEAFDSLDNSEPIVEDLRTDNNEESVNTIFRVFHTLKGLSGFFEMEIINKVTHEAETLLDVMRKQNKRQEEETITVIYQTFDFLRGMLQLVSTDFTDKAAAGDAEDMILILRDCLDKVVAGNSNANDDSQIVIDLSPPAIEQNESEIITSGSMADVPVTVPAEHSEEPAVENYVSDDMHEQ
jgi:two-component system chemotaxis sensor kinase CheA